MNDAAPTRRADWRARLTDPMVSAVVALGITQITAWGTSYYCLGVLAGPIGRDTGWSRGFIFLGFTVALLTMGLVSRTVGRMIDRSGARAVMTLGTVLVSAGLFALAHVPNRAAYLAVWAFLGLGMRLCLYDAAFAALVQVAPSRGRAAISYLTLFGAFASSVFWVVGHALNEQVGWRHTLVLFAVINLAVCLPLHWFGLARRESAERAPAPSRAGGESVDGPPLEGRVRSIAIALFALIMSLNGFVFGVISVQLVPLLEAAGLATAAAVWVASLKGVAQFGGRVVEIVFGRNLRAITVGRIAIGILPPSLLLLLAGTGSLPLVVAFTLTMGASQGVITIVRGAVPLALFGAKGYGAVLGVIATPVLVVGAVSPTVFAWIVDHWGWRVGRVSLLIGCSAAYVAMEVMSRWYERRRAAVAAGGFLVGVLCLLSWGAVVPAAAGPRTPDEIIAEVRQHTARYLDITTAREDGFVQISGMEPRHGYHFLNASSPLLSAVYDAVSGIDLARPPMLLYVERDGQWQLAGVEYALPRKPDVNPLPGADWHEHEASCHYRDYRELPGPSARDCPPTHPVSGERFVLWHPTLAVAHVWAWYPNPAGPFAEENAFLAPYGGAAPETPGHAHARNPAEALYSQMTHRASGALLLVLGAVIFWEGRRARRFPLNAISASIWIAFGVYLFATADPEAWPSGPKRFVEIFGDLSVLQHKLYALLLVAIGAIEGLRAYGTLRGGHARYLVPVIGTLGGTSLFVHLHDGSFHLNAIYLQHAAMGVIAVGLGATLWLTRRTHAERILEWAWPSCIVLMGIVLLFYVEG